MAYWLNDMIFYWEDVGLRQSLVSKDNQLLFVQVERLPKSNCIVYFSNQFREKFKIIKSTHYFSFDEAKQYVEQFVKTLGIKIINEDMLIFK
jgi:hypothetical protein